MSALAERKCEPCRNGAGALSPGQLETIRKQVNSAWRVADGRRLEREFKFPNFEQALHFTNRVGEIAEAENHHPDIQLSWGRVHLTLWTHAVGGLTENDFILAAKIDRLMPEM